MQIERVRPEELTENRLPDGSRILVDESNEKVFAQNVTAGAAWEACSTPTTLEQITMEMQRTATSEVSEELAADAVRQLEEQNLVRTSGSPITSSRRSFMGKMGAIAALPVVAALTMTEQRAYARNSTSGIQRHPHLSPPPPPPPPPNTRLPWL
jgi:hypothetical protein